MANQEHLNILLQGVEVWNKWRDEHPNIQPDLSHAKLRETNLHNANFHHANLYRAHFSGADLSGMNLSYSELSNAQLDRADLFEANLSHANLQSANFLEATLIDADLSWANLTKANLYGASLIRANLKYTCLNDSCIYGISTRNVQLEGASQHNLVISGDFEPTVTVDNLEIAQFIYLLLNHKKLRDVFNSVTEKGVLLLGRFSNGGLELLQAIAAKLREQQYLPMIFDFDKPDNRNYTETVKTLVGLSRFVIVDLSGPSVPQELYSTVPHYKIPFIPLIEEGRKTYAMLADLLEYPWVLSPVRFSSQKQLLELLSSRIIEPAEEKFKERQILLEQLFRR